MASRLRVRSRTRVTCPHTATTSSRHTTSGGSRGTKVLSPNNRLATLERQDRHQLRQVVDDDVRSMLDRRSAPGVPDLPWVCELDRRPAEGARADEVLGRVVADVRELGGRQAPRPARSIRTRRCRAWRTTASMAPVRTIGSNQRSRPRAATLAAWLGHRAVGQHAQPQTHGRAGDRASSRAPSARPISGACARYTSIRAAVYQRAATPGNAARNRSKVSPRTPASKADQSHASSPFDLDGGPAGRRGRPRRTRCGRSPARGTGCRPYRRRRRGSPFRLADEALHVGAGHEHARFVRRPSRGRTSTRRSCPGASPDSRRRPRAPAGTRRRTGR